MTSSTRRPTTRDFPNAASYLDALAEVIKSVPPEPMDRVLQLLLGARETGHRVYVMGNGGSAAIASQFVCNFSKTAQSDAHRPIRSFALVDNTPSLTAWSNDVEYGEAFARQLQALLEPEDVVIAISSSGNSPNIVAGLQAARASGAHTVALVGFDGGAAARIADVAVHIAQHNYGLVEDTHMAIGHALTLALRKSPPNAGPQG
jgi:D-sedoheptulose 7-phosphate isomerase